MTHALLFTASSARGLTLFGDLLPWIILLMVLVVVGGVVMMYFRRSIHADRDGASVGFTLQSLRDLHAAGELSDEEFQQAKAIMIGRLKTGENDDTSPQVAERAGNGSESPATEE